VPPESRALLDERPEPSAVATGTPRSPCSSTRLPSAVLPCRRRWRLLGELELVGSPRRTEPPVRPVFGARGRAESRGRPRVDPQRRPVVMTTKRRMSDAIGNSDVETSHRGPTWRFVGAGFAGTDGGPRPGAAAGSSRSCSRRVNRIGGRGGQPADRRRQDPVEVGGNWVARVDKAHPGARGGSSASSSTRYTTGARTLVEAWAAGPSPLPRQHPALSGLDDSARPRPRLPGDHQPQRQAGSRRPTPWGGARRRGESGDDMTVDAWLDRNVPKRVDARAILDAGHEHDLGRRPARPQPALRGSRSSAAWGAFTRALNRETRGGLLQGPRHGRVQRSFGGKEMAAELGPRAS